MIKSEIFPYELHFKQPAGTSRGVYTTRKVWYVRLTDTEIGKSGTGECAPLPNLSCDDIPDYEYVYAYFESGTVGVLRYWLDHPEDGKTPDEIASMIETIFTYGASLFKNDAEGRNGG